MQIISIAPRQWLSMSLLLMVGWAIACISVALQEPVLGITWQTAEHGLNVAYVQSGGPAERAGMIAGMNVLSISSADQHQDISSASITEEPSSLASYEVYNHFLRNKVIFSALYRLQRFSLRWPGMASSV